MSRISAHLKGLLRRVPFLRWLDDFTDTEEGALVAWSLIVLALVLLVVYGAMTL